MRRTAWTLLAATVLVALAAVALPGCVRRGPTAATPVVSGVPFKSDTNVKPDAALSTAIDDFGLDLVKATSTDPRSNAIVSPASVHAALSMTLNGAEGETAAQMRHVLHLDAMSAARSSQAWASLLGRLEGGSGQQRLDIAHSLWARKGVTFKKAFAEADRDYFGAEITTLDFAKDDVPGAINGWVSDNTHGMITKMVDQVPPNAILCLANAVYFKGEWVSPFDPEHTHTSSFVREDSSTVDVDMMYDTRSMPYTENAAFQSTKLAYKGGDTAFYVILPKPGVTTGAVLDTLKGEGFTRLRRATAADAPGKVTLALPRLDTGFSADLAKRLADLGMPLAFDDRKAQFSGIADLQVPIYVGRALHTAKVKVGEKGTEAAAATGMMSMAAGIASVEPAEIICDRPYIFAIVHEASGAMVFLGVVNDPTK